MKTVVIQMKRKSGAHGPKNIKIFKNLPTRDECRDNFFYVDRMKAQKIQAEHVFGSHGVERCLGELITP